MSDLHEANLTRWMARAVPEFEGLVTVQKFPHGQSNPTYRLDTPGGCYVLRRKPFGKLLPSAHAIEREHRLLSVLHPSGFPVPRPIALCTDDSVIGSVFYLMEWVAGRTYWDGRLLELPKKDRRSHYETMIDTIAALHGLNYQALGLGDFGAPGNYVGRQVARWTKQYRAAQTHDIPEVEKLIEWLPRTVREQTCSSIIHGDYRIDNLIYAPDEPQVRAVLDWELATIGDPLADFSYLAMNWVIPHEGRSGLADVDLDDKGLPSLDEAAARYCTATGRDSLPDLHWYFAYNLFRVAAIFQGIKKRAIDGTASNEQAAAIAERVTPLACVALTEARKAGANV
jgi:aminoglycoside phosphotransferase (APT) family kinase protein